jgi:hypothetical protein
MELGEMKLEDEVAWMVCKQPKVYRYEASKGVDQSEGGSCTRRIAGRIL